MMPTRDEFLVLAACEALARSGRASFRPGELESGALKLSEGKPCEPAGAIESLAQRGWLLPSDSGADYTLSGEAAIVARMAGTDEVSPALFNEWLTRSAASPAYLRFCDKVYGTPFVEFDMVDREQLEYFIEKAGPGPGLRVLDLGCGIGSQAEYISDMTGADVTGVDYADQAVEVARKRCASRADRLHFAVGNLDSLDPSLGLFDIIVSFDTLYFVKDLSKSLADIMGHLAPGGRFYAFFTDGPGRDDPEGRAPASPGASKLGTMLSGMGLRFEALDFSANEEVLWAKSLEWAEKLRPDFEAEGCLDLYWGRVIESNECVSLWRDGKLRRWLFVAEAPGPSISG